MSNVIARFAHISDTHIQAKGTQMSFGSLERYPSELRAYIQDGGRWLPQPPPMLTGADASALLVKEIQLLPFELDFVLHTGDIGHDIKREGDYANAHQILSAIPYPIYYACGNHDLPNAVQTVLMGRLHAVESLDYTEYHNGLQIVCVDSSKRGELGGRLTPQQLEWLEKVTLQNGSTAPLIICIHHPPLGYDVEFHDRFGLANGEAFHEIVCRTGERLRGVFVGHNHQELTTFQDGVQYFCAMSPYYQSNTWPTISEAKWVGARPNPGFSVVTITEKRTYIRRYHYSV